MKRLALVCAPMLFVVVGCGGDGSTSSDTHHDSSTGGSGDHLLYEEHITLNDGRTVTCVVYSHARAEEGGVSCDWNTAGEGSEFAP